MQKKTTFAIMLLLYICTVLCSCASNHREDVNFIHAVAIMQDGKSGNISLLAVAEKQGAKDSDSEYFIASSKGKTIDSAVENMTKKYSGCYFASCELYIIPTNEGSELTRKAAAVCQNGSLPSHAYTLCSDSGKIPEILELLVGEEEIISLISKVKDSAPVFVRFLSQRLSGTSVTLPVVTDGKDKTVQIAEYAVFLPDGSVSYRKEKKQ